VIEFGRFKVVRHRRELLADGRPLELGSRAFDTLIALIDARGTVLSKEDLMSRVWPDRVVEENNLAAQIFALRKLFGADRQLIRTVAGRGYQFTGDIRVTAAPAGGPAPPLMTNLPEAVSELIGREAELAAVTALATEHRLVSLVGAGGIGKTRLGLEVARHLVPRFPDGVLVAELGPLSSPELVPAAMASALGLTHVAHTLTNEGVAGAVGTKTLLLVMDNCEHVIDAAARMAEALLRASPGVSLVATSREPLRVSGEYVFRVPPLDVPAEDNKDMEGVFKYGAVRLFVSRARAAEPRYVTEGRVAAATVAICRRPHIDDLRTALDWAFSPSGDLAVGVALTAATVPLWTHLSLLTECRERVEQAITSLAQVPSDPRRDMRLYLALGQVLSHFHASARPEVNAALTKALNLAEITGDGGYRLAALHGLYLARLYTGEYRSALDLAETFRTGAAETADRSDVPIGNLLIGLTRHVLGDQPGARRQLEPLVRSRFVTARPSHISLYQYDHRVVLECYYARVMWLQGFGDKARGLTQKVVDYVRTIDHLRSFLYTLTIGTCPIALFVGDLETVENHVRLAFNLAARHALEIWSVWAQCFEGILLIRRGNNLAARSCSSRRSRDCRSPPFIIT
jgi:DNA-binding winged helix-turn-helix (wHTH) protein